MTMRLKTLIYSGLAAAGLALGSPTVSAQNPPEGVEVLARGPIHEAYATTTEQPTAAAVVGKAPPDPVEELPPDQKPDGDNVQFIPGYWSYDEDRSDYIWISGFWRATPPGRVWVPGSWRQTAAGWQWTAGLWQEAAGEAEPQIQYLPPPPEPLEIAPATPAPTATSFYVPGSWVHRQRYVWRPGFWIEHRPGWVWTPAYYRWTPVGYVYVDGYWDYPLAGRGCLFAPVYFAPVHRHPRFVYTPAYVVREPVLYSSLFIRRGYGSYYFGDYFEPRYSTIGFSAWIGGGGSGFAIGVGVNTRPRYDPLWDYYRYSNRNDPTWAVNVNAVYVGRYNGTVARPPRTLVQQNTVVNNVVNNTTVVNNNTTIINNNQMMLTSIKDVQKVDKTVVLKPVTKDQQVVDQKLAKDLRDVSAQRNRLETSLADRGRGVARPNDQVQAIKLDVSKQVVARAQMPTDAKKAPPPPVTKLQPVAAPAATKVDPVKPNTPKVDPVKPTTPKVDPVKPKVDPPKGNPPKVDPPKVDPPKGSPPKVDPVKPKVDPPKGNPPKVDPPKTNPPVVPKVDPPKTNPPVVPKVDPPKGTPPKIDPPRPVRPRVDPPKADPPKVDPPKVDPPKVDPPKTNGSGFAAQRQRFDAKPVVVAPPPKAVIPTAKPAVTSPAAPAPKPAPPVNDKDKDKKKDEPKKG